MKCPLFKSGLGTRCLPGGRHEWLPEGRRGADDEDPRSDFASDGEEGYVVAGSGDHRDHRPMRRWHWRYKESGYDGLLESRTHRGIPTFPQPRRRSLNLKPDISCALKSGHFNLLTTVNNRRFSSRNTNTGTAGPPPYEHLVRARPEQ